MSSKPNVLVVLATGKMGSGVCDAFLSLGYNVYGTSRDANSPKLTAKGVTPVAFAFGDKASMVNALNVSKASVVFFITDFAVAAKMTASIELAHAVAIIDACKEVGVAHTIFCSAAFCDVCPDNVNILKSKLAMEKYLVAANLPCYTILRSVSFFENFDDAATHNPLTKGFLKGLYAADLMIALVATKDVGKAAAAAAADPAKWGGKTVTCAACNVTLTDCAKALSDASGVSCVYKKAVPTCLLACLVPELYKFVVYMRVAPQPVPVDEFKLLVPDSMGPYEWFKAKGAWANGNVF